MEIIPARDVVQILRDEGITNRFWINQEQEDTTYPAITVRRYGGSANPRWARDQILLQIRSKGDTFGAEQAETDLYKIRDVLLGVSTIDFSPNYEYVRFLIVSDVQYIGTDDDNKPIFTLNMEATVDWKVPVGNRLPIN